MVSNFTITLLVNQFHVADKLPIVKVPALYQTAIYTFHDKSIVIPPRSSSTGDDHLIARNHCHALLILATKTSSNDQLGADKLIPPVNKIAAFLYVPAT